VSFLKARSLEDGRYASQYVAAGRFGCEVVGCVFHPATGVKLAVEASSLPGPPPGPDES
jgi:hypothetical protein